MFYGIMLCRRIGPDKEHQMAAFVKGIVCDYGDGFRKLQCQEIAAIDKSFGTDLNQAFRNGDLIEAPAAGKDTRSN